MLSSCAAQVEDDAEPVATLHAELNACQSYTASVQEHLDARRAYARWVLYRWRYYAVGSGEYLGTDRSKSVTLREDPPGYFYVGTECPPQCVPAAETCDGVDDDCDGQVDEDGVCEVPACVAYTGTVVDHVSAGRAYPKRVLLSVRYYAVGSNDYLGKDKAAVVTLREEPAGYFSVGEACPCVPSGPEICDDLDNDCDGARDESYLCMPVETAPAIDELITRCPPAAVLDGIDEDFDIRFEFTGDLTGEGLFCTAAEGSRDLTHFEERVYQALIALRALEFNAALPWTDKNLYEWMADSIDGIRLRTDITASSCCAAPSGAIGEYVNLVASPSLLVLQTDLWYNGDEQGLNSLVQLMVHEARHADDKPHTCGSSDDLTLEELGAWATVYYLYRALAFNIDPCFMRPTLPADPAFPGQMFGSRDYTEGMRSLAYDTLQRRICEPSVTVPNPPEPVPVCN